MAIGDYQGDDGTLYPGPDPAEEIARREQEQRDADRASTDAARRAFIREEYVRLTGREPDESQLNEAYDRYMRGGGDEMRAWLSSLNAPTGGSGGLGDLVTYGGPMRPDYQFDAAPQFDFSAPTETDLYADPSYQFRRDEGQKGIEASAAARGLLRTGGTLKDILGYNQKFASQEYGNVYDRRFSEAQTRFRPRFDEWMFKAGASKDAADKEFDRRWDSWTYDHPSASEIFRTGAGM